MVRRGRRRRCRRAGRKGVGATAPGERPERRCIVTGEIRDRAALVRLVVDPNGRIVPDVEARLPGRGLWLTPRRDIVDRAVAKRIFARVARQPVSAPPELADTIEGLLARRCVDALGLARRAGLAVAGFDRVADMLRHGRAGLVLVARDAAAGGQQRVAALTRAVPSAWVLTAAEQGAAFGRERIVYAAVGAGPLCRRVSSDLTRLAGLRADAQVEAGTDFAPAGPAIEDDGTKSA